MKTLVRYWWLAVIAVVVLPPFLMLSASAEGRGWESHLTFSNHLLGACEYMLVRQNGNVMQIWKARDSGPLQVISHYEGAPLPGYRVSADPQ